MHPGRIVTAALAIEECEVPMRDRFAGRLPQHGVQRDRRARRLAAAQIVDGAPDQALDAGFGGVQRRPGYGLVADRAAPEIAKALLGGPGVLGYTRWIVGDVGDAALIDPHEDLGRRPDAGGRAAQRPDSTQVSRAGVASGLIEGQLFRSGVSAS